jgi:hypothetical protein
MVKARAVRARRVFIAATPNVTLLEIGRAPIRCKPAVLTKL